MPGEWQGREILSNHATKGCCLEFLWRFSIQQHQLGITVKRALARGCGLEESLGPVAEAAAQHIAAKEGPEAMAEGARQRDLAPRLVALGRRHGGIIVHAPERMLEVEDRVMEQWAGKLG